ncbi:MAG: Choline-sulfatase [candidate division BRC1 bacterium ADurb.BinA364]|nr:MAG: Choline-sulfatase [candidate division BRC1 bacterium ADurb.BinA364]
MRRNRIPAAIMIAAAFSAFGAAFAAAPAKPNIAVFLCDDHGYLDSEAYGAEDVRTPNMKKLAEDGLVFANAFIASPSCAPSRAALLTGLMPARNGAEANHTYPRAEIKKLPAYLQDAGYEVAAFGKVAHGKSAKDYGFDHFVLNFDLQLVAKYLAERDASKPLCLFVGTNDPHVPWTKNTEYDAARIALPPAFFDTPETRQLRTDYYTEVTRADADLATLRALAAEALGSNTLFIYTSDHGAQWPFGKWNLYDSSIRTPFIAVWPGVIEPGSKTDAMVSWIDILPTFVDLAGGNLPSEIDGKSFAGVLLGKRSEHRSEIYTTHSGDGTMNVYPIRSLRTPDYKYILNLHPEFAHTTHIDKAAGRDGLIYWNSWYRAAQAGDEKAAAIVRRYHERPREELYDLKRDPNELANLADLPEYRETLGAMRAKVQAWMQEQGDAGTVFNTPRLLSDPKSTIPAGWKAGPPPATNMAPAAPNKQ